MGDYTKLRVWQQACDFADKVEAMVDRLSPSVRARHGEQLCRAASSIHENIAEGCGLNSDRQLLEFSRQALGSANESEDELLALKRRGHLKECDFGLLDQIRRICAMLAVLIRRVDSSVSSRTGPRQRADSG